MALPNQEYLKTKVMTASPESLTLMLWDGAIRFAEQGKEAIQKKDIEGSYKALLRSQQIITELTTSLKHEVHPDLCGKLAALYNFMYRRLVDANLTKNPQLVDDALEIMRHQRQTWSMLIEKLVHEKAVGVDATIAANTDAADTVEAAQIGVAAQAEPAPRGFTAGPRPIPAAPAPARRSYPAFAVRPPVAATASLSVQG